MKPTRLVVVEGIPGSGKSTLAAFIHKWLNEHQRPAHLYLEGNLDHPADYESVAWFSRRDYAPFLDHHAAFRAQLEQFTTYQEENCFVAYRKLDLALGQQLPREIIDELSTHDVYELPTASAYCRLALDRWRAFSALAQTGPAPWVFECCLVQNPLTVLLVKHNMAPSGAIHHIQTIVNDLKPLDPVIIYLYQKDTRAALERITRERPQEWQDFLIAYTERGAWCQANHLHGFEAVIAMYEMRKAVELDLFRQMDIPILMIDNSDYDWKRCEQKILDFLG